MTEESDPSKKNIEEQQNTKGENKAGDTFDMSGDFRGATLNIKSTVVSDAEKNVITQNLRDFTVQIRDANDEIVGMGVAVSPDGKIVTCAHVVESAGIDPRKLNGEDIVVQFSQIREGEEKKRRATVIKYFEGYEDDIVLLQLTGTFPLAPEQIAVVGSTGKLDNRDFDSYVYYLLDQQPVGKFVASEPIQGKILGTVELVEENKFHRVPFILESNQFWDGMSGAAVLDIEDNLVVGIISYILNPKQEGGTRNSALGVDARVLPIPPFEFSIRTEPLPKLPAPNPITDEETSEQVLQIAQSTLEQWDEGKNLFWKNSPEVLDEWTGREDLLKQINAVWDDSAKHVVGLIGFGGEGKSSLARKWVDDLLGYLTTATRWCFLVGVL